MFLQLRLGFISGSKNTGRLKVTLISNINCVKRTSREIECFQDLMPRLLPGQTGLQLYNKPTSLNQHKLDVTKTRKKPPWPLTSTHPARGHAGHVG